jgi:hypothetical protein
LGEADAGFVRGAPMEEARSKSGAMQSALHPALAPNSRIAAGLRWRKALRFSALRFGSVSRKRCTRFDHGRFGVLTDALRLSVRHGTAVRRRGFPMWSLGDGSGWTRRRCAGCATRCTAAISRPRCGCWESGWTFGCWSRVEAGIRYHPTWPRVPATDASRRPAHHRMTTIEKIRSARGCVRRRWRRTA